MLTHWLQFVPNNYVSSLISEDIKLHHLIIIIISQPYNICLFGGDATEAHEPFFSCDNISLSGLCGSVMESICLAHITLPIVQAQVKKCGTRELCTRLFHTEFFFDNYEEVMALAWL